MTARLAEGRYCIVTGAGAGIGRATALLFAEEGAAGVAVTDIDAAGAEETARLVTEFGTMALAFPADIAEPAAPGDFVTAAVNKFGRIDAAVNCAGVGGPVKPVGEYTDEEWARVFSVNLDAVFRGIRAQANAMCETGGGAIVSVSSGSIIDPVPNMSAYVASKQGVAALTRVAAGEYVRRGIRVNAVLPGGTNTQMLAAHTQTEQGKRQVANYPMARLAEPREVAEAIVWLCSPRASYLTGVELPVDGGSHAFWYPQG